MKLSENEKTNYFYNSYIKAGSLLFVKVEENLGFELALENWPPSMGNPPQDTGKVL